MVQLLISGITVQRVFIGVPRTCNMDFLVLKDRPPVLLFLVVILCVWECVYV